jgi:hypothetical protein
MTEYSSAAIAAACAVERITIRSWLARSPGFVIGRYTGLAKAYSHREALTLIVAGEMIARGIAQPYIVLPTAERIVRGDLSRTVWVTSTPGGEVIVSDSQPPEPTVCLPLPALTARLVRTTPQAPNAFRGTHDETPPPEHRHRH